MSLLQTTRKYQAAGKLFQLREQALEPRIAAEAVVIGIVLDPVAFPAAFGEYALEQRKRLFLLSGFDVHAGGVDQRAGVVRAQVERSLRPLERAEPMAIREQADRTHRQRTDI